MFDTQTDFFLLLKRSTYHSNWKRKKVATQRIRNVKPATGAYTRIIFIQKKKKNNTLAANAVSHKRNNKRKKVRSDKTTTRIPQNYYASSFLCIFYIYSSLGFQHLFVCTSFTRKALNFVQPVFFSTNLKASVLVKIVSCKIVLIICQPLASSLPGN